MSSGLSLSDFLVSEHGIYSRPPHGLDKWDARLKLGLCTGAILANVLLPNISLSLALVLVAWLGLAFSRVAPRQAALFIVAPLWATVMVMLGFSLGFGTQVLYHLGPISFYREGVALGLAAALRVVAEMSWTAALMLTTPLTDILAALRWYKIPAVVTDVLAAMYRYIFVLFDEYKSMAAAAKARGGFKGYRRSLATLGLILAQGFLRALDRAERVDMAMRVRGAGAGGKDLSL